MLHRSVELKPQSRHWLGLDIIQRDSAISLEATPGNSLSFAAVALNLSVYLKVVLGPGFGIFMTPRLLSLGVN